MAAALEFDSQLQGLKQSAPAVRPRDAATLVVARRDGARPRLLMGRRAGGHNFMPGKWVFPGGRIDRADFHAPHVGEFQPETARRLCQGAAPRRALALALAAVRETFEETGLLLARPAPPRPAAGGWHAFLAQGAVANIAPLTMIGRAVTPPMLPKRFDARFFLADAEALMSLTPSAGCGELDEIAWVEIEEAAALDLPAITRFIVRDVAKRLAGEDPPALMMRFSRGRSTAIPI